MNRFFIMTAICLGAFVSHFTAGVIHVSLPQFAALFDSNLDTIQWVTTGYLLVIATLLPLMGKLGDRYGHRIIHNSGYVIFAIGSILAALAPNIVILLLMRVVQGIGAAMFQATNIAIITIHLPKASRGRALGTVSTAVALGAMSGPIAGGFIMEWLEWRWLFLIHVPVILVAAILALRYIPRPDQQYAAQQRSNASVAPRIDRHDRLDWLGAVLFMLSVSSAIVAVSVAQAQLAIFILAAVAFCAFVLWELRQRSPFLPIRLLRIPSLSCGLIISVASFMIANTVLVFLPFYFSTLTGGFSPSASGYLMAIYPILLALAGPVAGHWSDRHGSTRFMRLGMIIMGVALVLLLLALPSFQSHASIMLPIVALAMLGAGMGILAAPNNSFIMQQAPQEHVGSIGGLIALTRNLGMVGGAAMGLRAMNATVAADKEGDSISLLGALHPTLIGYLLLTFCIVIPLGLSVRRETNSKPSEGE